MQCVDLDDLACRESQEVVDCYLSGWFSREKKGELYFNPPAFYLENGRALFINGRHRAILLSRYLEILPMALTQVDTISQNVLGEIIEREIELEEVFQLPDLPIREAIDV